MISLGILTSHHYPRLGGMESVTHIMASELNKKSEVRVSVACNSLKGIPKNFNYAYNCYRSKRFSYLTPFLFNYNQDRMIKEQCVNLLYGPMLHDGGYFAYLKHLKHDIPFIGHSHGADVQVVEKIGYGALLNHDLKKKINKVIQHSAHLIAVSEINKQDMLALGAREGQISVVHNGIDIEKINAIPFRSMREYWGVKDDDYLIITVGRNKPVKRMELLFQALSKIKDTKKIKCICVGPIQDLNELSKQNGNLSNVIFTGQIPNQIQIGLNPPYPDLINLYRSSNLYISTSYVESYGSATADALACGIPVIIGSKHGVQDIMDGEKSGYVMEKETPEELAGLILECYNNREQLADYSSTIKDSVAHVNWINIANKYERVFKSVL